MFGVNSLGNAITGQGEETAERGQVPTAEPPAQEAVSYTHLVIYSDEDKVTTDLSEHFQPHFKPDFNLDLLRSNNYITHFFLARTALVRQTGGFRREYDLSLIHI